MTNSINYFFMRHHRYLRETFKMETIERHENRIMRALDARWAIQCKAGVIQ